MHFIYLFILNMFRNCTLQIRITLTLPNHLSSILTLPALRRALQHHLFLLAYPDSSAKSGNIKPAQCITLCDTGPTTAIARPGNTIPPS